MGWSGGKEVLGADGRDERDDFDVVREGEVLFGDSAGGDAAWVSSQWEDNEEEGLIDGF